MILLKAWMTKECNYKSKIRLILIMTEVLVNISNSIVRSPV